LEEIKDSASRLKYSFGPFQLEPAERRLLRDGRDLRLSPKIFDTLVILVERHGLLVEKDDLMKALWPGMFVEEVTLARNISLLRKALGDVSGQDESQYIETVSKRGYRFIAEVSEIGQRAASSGAGALSVAPSGPSKDGWRNRRAWNALPGFGRSSSDTTGAPAGRSPRAVRIAWGAAGVLLGALVGMGIVYVKLKNAAPANIVVRSTILPPADHQFAMIGDENGGSRPAISADGRLLVSPVQDAQGKRSLWLRGLNDAGEGRMLSGTDGARDPFWSPDGRSIGFFAEGKLKRIDSDGSGLQVLCDALVERGGAWSSGGIILFTPMSHSQLYQIPANGGTPRQITTLNTGRGEQSHRWPVFLADGRRFLFFVVNKLNPEMTGIYAGSLDSQDYHIVVKSNLWAPGFETSGTILYLRDGAVVAQPFDERKLVTTGEPTVLPDRVACFAASRAGVLAFCPATPGGPSALTWYDRDGRHGDPLDTGKLAAPALSPDGTQAVETIISADGSNSDLWSFDLSRGTKTRLTSGRGHHQVAIWQPDGRFVLFASILSDHPHISRIKSDGTGAVESVLETPGVREIAWSVCRDGQYVAYSRSPTGSRDSVWILPLTGDRKPFALVQSQFTNTNPAFSPDCKWIAYHSNETGQDEVYITHFPDAARRYQVSTRGGDLPHWSSDGRELFYFSQPQSSMMVVNVDEKAEELSLGSPRALFHLSGLVGSPFDVTADGRRFLIAEGYPPAGPLTLVTNWQAELKKR
jgi:DNA-binding winged helix-turn-helix (wHTH) protein/Tol biopolymer transport system component